VETIDLSTLSSDVLAAGAELAEESGLLAVADAALDQTGDTGQAAAIIGDVVDILIDFEAIDVLGPLGVLLEERDDDIASWLAGMVIAIALDPTRREARQERRADRRARWLASWEEGKERRQDRRAERRAE